MNADCFVSIHVNADLDEDLPGMPEAKGEEIWIHKGSRQGLILAKCLADEVDRIFPDEPFRGIKETEALYVLKHTKAPACLLEIGFIDKSSSYETFADEMTLRKIGVFIARGIRRYLENRI
jgi:N-acetylmuramoyl-L-alanine amidase